MAAIFREVTLGWKGEEYQIKPSMALLNRIEQKVSLAGLANGLAAGEPKLTHVATAVAIMLQSAGVSVSDEDVYVELMHGDRGSVSAMAQAIVIAAFPETPKGNAPRPKKSAKK